MNDALSTLKDHAPSMPSASDVRDAVQSHLPSVDMSAMRDAVKDKALDKSHSKSRIAMLIGALAGAAAVFGFVRKRRNTTPVAATYTPPLPRP